MSNHSIVNISNFNQRIHIARLLLPLMWATVLSWCSLTSSPPQLPGVLGWDKPLHVLAYFLLTLLVGQYLLVHQLKPMYAGIWALVLSVSYGGFLELAQAGMSSGRTADWWDLAANLFGSFLGCVVFRQALVFLSDSKKGLTDG